MYDISNDTNTYGGFAIVLTNKNTTSARTFKHLSEWERGKIFAWLEAGVSQAEMARRLGSTKVLSVEKSKGALLLNSNPKEPLIRCTSQKPGKLFTWETVLSAGKSLRHFQQKSS